MAEPLSKSEIEITPAMIDAGIEALRREHYVSDMPMWNARELVEDVIRRALVARRAQIAQHAA